MCVCVYMCVCVCVCVFMCVCCQGLPPYWWKHKEQHRGELSWSTSVRVALLVFMMSYWCSHTHTHTLAALCHCGHTNDLQLHFTPSLLILTIKPEHVWTQTLNLRLSLGTDSPLLLERRRAVNQPPSVVLMRNSISILKRKSRKADKHFWGSWRTNVQIL